jgi:(2Fe-2S) ferredoxin
VTSLVPYYRLHLFVCTNQRAPDDPRGCCADKGAADLRDHLKQRVKQAGLKGVRINNAGCLDRCSLGPVLVVYPEGIWYGADSIADIDEIFDQHVLGGNPVARLQLRPEDRQRRRAAL